MRETPKDAAVVDCLREQQWSRVGLAREVVSLRDERDALRGALMIPGEQRCVTCGFELHKLVVRAADGAIGVNAATPLEECPNGCGYLVGVTYEQGWREMVRAAEAATVAREKAETALREVEIGLLENIEETGGSGPPDPQPSEPATARDIALVNLLMRVRAALRDTAPAEQDWDPVYGDPKLALRKVAGILRNESFALRVEAALDVIDEALS